ncbi:MAG: flagellar biosynthesis anti-sigma factor FlgM [Nitrospinae bacterium]|nr:flagellar biosynthesis anti-sigma factor FlgM [Nitrospinota bacterium]
MIIKPNLPGSSGSVPGVKHIGNNSQVKGAVNNYASQAKQVSSSGEEKVAVSDVGKALNVANAAIKQVPDMRSERIEKLKSEIERGVYSVDSGKVADKIMKEFLPV